MIFLWQPEPTNIPQQNTLRSVTQFSMQYRITEDFNGWEGRGKGHIIRLVLSNMHWFLCRTCINVEQN